MTRFHVHVTVPALDPAIVFYEALFGRAPVRREADYAKWVMEDPALNFAISVGEAAGLSHLGFEAPSEDVLADLAARAAATRSEVLQEEKAECCYAVSDKAWIRDPAGIAWENFHTSGSITVYGDARGFEAKAAAPATPLTAGCCTG
ncbi:MAG: glyoxalase/bleomycin resistance/dioxygenase family protein [Alphaproteobacteria bacterium]|nr:glyoxalase/bleomycin resistance/dioxygenase family protein [Alphaproteobacteria bacterium]